MSLNAVHVLELPPVFPRVSGGKPRLLALNTTKLSLGNTVGVSDTPTK